MNELCQVAWLLSLDNIHSQLEDYKGLTRTAAITGCCFRRLTCPFDHRVPSEVMLRVSQSVSRCAQPARLCNSV